MRDRPAINLFYGGLSQNAARIYAQVNSLPGGAEWSFRGTVRGPRNTLGHTLPASFSFRDLGAGPSLLAEALVTEPCFWSAKLPALYDVSLELCYRGEVQQTVTQAHGIRFLGAFGRNLILEGERWVLRGVSSSSTRAEALDVWRECSAAMVVGEPSDELCRRASAEGVWLVASLEESGQTDKLLRRLRTWAAVAVVILPGEVVAPAELRRIAPNILFAQRWNRANVQLASWADLVFADVDEPAAFAAVARQCPLPLVAVRRLREGCDLAAARRACDVLQRDLAPGSDCAGYVV